MSVTIFFSDLHTPSHLLKAIILLMYGKVKTYFRDKHLFTDP
jgi:hypothetical protein